MLHKQINVSLSHLSPFLILSLSSSFPGGRLQTHAYSSIWDTEGRRAAEKKKNTNKIKNNNPSTDVCDTVWLPHCVLIWKSEGRRVEILAAGCSSCDFTGKV